MEGWDHKDIWRKRGKNFCIEVSRHSAPALHEGMGTNRWCVYAYIYIKHPHFSAFSGGDMLQDAAYALHLHRGPSFLKWHVNIDGAVTSVQVGADYNHLYDDIFTLYDTPERASQVFNDAEELFERLENWQ